MSAAPTVISQNELLRRRLQGQNVGPTAAGTGDVATTVRRLFATQSQDFTQSLWGVGLRTSGARRSDVLAAMASGSIVRSSSLRGTLMMIAAEDLRGILSLTAERTIASTRTRQRQLELDDPTMTRARQVIEKAIAGRNALGREAVLRTLEEAGIRTNSQRGYHILWLLAEHGIVCWGPPCGTQQGLVLVDEWIEPAPVLERDEQLARFVIRYFAGHGPATVADLAWWARLTLADVRRGIAGAGKALCEVAVDGTNYWMCADSAPPQPAPPQPAPPQPASPQPASPQPASPQPEIVALPGFDEYLLGYSDRSAALAPENVERVVPGTNGIFLPTIVAAGRVIGIWRRTIANDVTELTPELFDALTPMQYRSFDAAVDRYREFSAN